MGFLRFIPFFAILLVLYNVMMMAGTNFGSGALPAMSMTLPSGATWTLTTGDLLIALGVIILYIEIFKATRTSSDSIIEHGISMIVFVAFIIEFIVVKNAGTSTFFILTLMSMLDVIGGFTVTISSARRDMSLGG
jgi:hypothetical protein